MKAVVAWSGGKDCCLALHLAKEQGIKIVALLSMLDETNNCSRSNGVAREILEAQAEQLGIPILYINTGWDNYRQNLLNGLMVLKEKYQIDRCIFGDMDNQAHKNFNDALCKDVDLKSIMPLWGKSRFEVYTLIRKHRIKAKLSVVRKNIGIDNLLGVDYTRLDIFELLEKQVDICGEKGEFHTLVYDAQAFNQPLKIAPKEMHELETVKMLNYILT